MNIKSAESTTVHFVETDDNGYTLYTRYSADNWTVRMGESDESVYDCAELEAAFQVNRKDKMKPDDKESLTTENGPRGEHSSAATCSTPARAERIRVASDIITDEHLQQVFRRLAYFEFPEASVFWDSEETEAYIETDDFAITFSSNRPVSESRDD